MEFLVRNGAPRIVQDLKDDLYKLRTLQDMQYRADGVDKTAGIREKSKAICEIISDPQRLEEEREYARKNKEKFRGFSGTDVDYTKNKYGGFGSDDVNKHDNYSGAGSGYDPYKKDSIFSGTEPKPEKKKKKKRKPSTSEEDDSDSDEESDESDEEEQPKKISRKKKAKGVAKPSKKKAPKQQQVRAAPPPPQQKQEPSIAELFEQPSAPAPAASTGLGLFDNTTPVSQPAPQPGPLPT